MPFTPEEREAARRLGINITNIASEPDVPRFTSYIPRTRWEGTVPEEIQRYRTTEFERNLLRGRRTAGDHHIWQMLTPATHYQASPQQAIDAFRKARKAIARGQGAYLDVEILGGLDRDFFAMTEIAVQHRNETFQRIIRPTREVESRLRGIISDIERVPGRATSLRDHEWRAMRDLIKYADMSQGDIQALRDISNIRPGTSLAGHTAAIKRGLDNLIAYGADPTEAARDLNDYVARISQRAYFVTFGGATADYPWLNAFLTQHGSTPLSTSRHMDARQVIESLGLAGEIDMPGMSRQKTLEAIAKRWGVRSAAWTQTHVGADDIGVLRDLVEGTTTAQGLIPRGRERLIEMAYEARNLYRPGAMRGLGPTRIGTGMAYSTRPLQIGDELFTVAGMKQGFEEPGRGMYDMIFERTHRHGRWEAIDWMDTTLYRNVRYRFAGIRPETIEGRQYYSMFLEAPELDAMSKITRESVEELQNIVHQRTMPWRIAEGLGYDPFVQVQDPVARSTELVRRRELETAQRTYRRILDPGRGQNTGYRLARRLYTAAQEYGHTGRMPRDLTTAQTTTVRLMHGRLHQEADLMMPVLEDIASRHRSRPEGTMTIFEQDLAFGRALQRLGPHRMEQPIAPWERQLEILSDYGRVTTPRVAEGFAARRGRYTTLSLADPDAAMRTVMGAIRGYDLAGTVDEEQIARTNIRRVVHDLERRGIIDEDVSRRVLGTPTGEAPQRVASRQAEILVRALRNLSPRHSGLIDTVPFEHIGRRAGELPYTREQIQGLTDEVVNEVMFRRSSVANRIFGRDLMAAPVQDETMQRFFDGIGRVTPSGAPVNYEDALRNIVRQVEGRGLRTSVVPMLDPRSGEILSMQLQIYPESLARQAVRAAYLTPGEIIPGVATVDLPMVTPQGRIQHGGLSRLPVPRIDPHDPRRRISTMESIAERSFAPGVMRRVTDLMARGQFVEAQATLRRSITTEVQRLPGVGRAYVEAGQIDYDRWALSHPVVADELKAQLVSAEDYLEERLYAKHGRTDFITVTDRYRNLVEEYPRLLRQGYFAAGKDEEIARGFVSMVDVHSLHPFGPMLSPGREAVRQYFGHYRLQAPDVLERQIADLGLEAGITTRKLLTTPALERMTADLAGEAPYQMGLRMKTAYMTDVDLRRSIEAALQRTDISPDVKRELRQMRFVASTYEGMIPIAREALSLFEASYEKAITLDPDQARRVGEAIEAGTLGQRLLPFQEIVPDLRWRDLGVGDIIGIEELDTGGARLRVRSTIDAEGTVKLVFAGGEKGTTVPFSRAAIEAITPEGTVAIARPDFTKHTTPGMWIEGQLAKAYAGLSPDEATRFMEDVNRAAGNARLLSRARVDNALYVSEEVVRGLDKDQAYSIMQAIRGYARIHEDIHGIPVVTAMPEWVRMRVGDPLFYSDAEGMMMLRGQRITGRGAQLGFRELQALRGRGDEALAPALQYFERAIHTLPEHEPFRRAQVGAFRAAQALFDPAVLQEITDVRHMTGPQALRPLTGPIEGGRYLDIAGTALRPMGTDIGDIYRLALPDAVTRQEVGTLLGTVGLDDPRRGALDILHQYMPERIESVPMAVQHHPGTYVSGVAAKQARLAEDVQRLHTAISDVERYVEPTRRGITTQTAAQQARFDVIHRLASYYEQMNVELMSSKGETFRRVMHGRLNMSARLTLQGIAPYQMEELARYGIGEHTAFVSERFARDILGEADYTRYFGDIDPTTGIAARGGERLTGLGVRYPTIGVGSVAPLEFRVAQWAQPDTVYATPGTVKMWHGDFDDDKLAIFMAHARGKMAPYARRAREAIGGWVDRHAFAGQAHEAGQRIIQDESRLLSLLAPHQVLGPEQRQMYGDVLDSVTRLTHPDIRHAIELHGTRVKAAKMLIGPTSVVGSMMRSIAEPVYGAGSVEYQRIAKLTEAFEQSAFQIQHGVAGIDETMDTRQITAQISRAEPPALRAIDTLRNVMRGRLTPEHVRSLEDLQLKGFTSTEEYRAALQQVEELASMRIGRGMPQKQLQALLQQRDFMEKETLALAAGGPRVKKDLMHHEILDRALRQLGDAGVGRADEIRMGDVFVEAMDQATYRGRIEELTKPVRPPGVMERMGLGDMKFTRKTGMWALGIAAGLYAFQRMRGTAQMMDRPRQPQPDAAPEVDGEYPSFMMDQQQPSSPIGRVYERGYGYDGLQVRVRGTRRGAALENEYIAQSVADAMQAQIPVPMEVNVHSQDSRSRMNQQQVQEIVARAIKGY